MLVIAVLVTAPAAETRVAGLIDRDVRWVPEKGPYIVTDDLLIERRGRLIIAPGTRVIIGRPVYYDKSIKQLDYTDSITVAIKVKGVLSCLGRRNNRIVFSPLFDSAGQCTWYGIVFDGADSRGTEMAFTDVAGACNGTLVMASSPLIRNCVLEYNNVGIHCAGNGNARVYNCIVARNSAVGVKTHGANPVFYNNIIAFNRNNGVWSDGISAMTFMHNCVFGNSDGNLLDCDPELGVLKKTSAKKDSIDYAHNLYKNPVFAGSVADSLAVERDVSLPTEKSRLADTAMAKILHDSLPDSLAARRRSGIYARYALSSYSPCINAGSPRKEFRDSDGSVNDMGIHGGPEFFVEK